MSTSRGYYKFRRVFGAFKCRSGNLFLSSLGVEGFPTFPKWLLLPHYPGLKLKTGKKEGGRLVEPPKAPPFFCCRMVSHCLRLISRGHRAPISLPRHRKLCKP